MKRLMSLNTADRLRARIARLYPDHVEQSMQRLTMMVGRYGLGQSPPKNQGLWNQKDAVLITYGDSIQSESCAPLETLRKFATRHFMGAFSTIHLLPFYPYSSDDGFSVINFRKVDPALGDWPHIHSIKDHFDLMFDWVLNHASSRSAWFRDFVNCIQPYRNYFVEASPKEDLSAVTRPRTSPLLTPIQTKSGETHVWTTFSADQVDLNWHHPDVFFEMLDVLFGYIASGARIVRLDAVAFLWKRPGTTCLHLDETHEIIRLLRDILQIVAPSVIILTETNVPHQENISYFGDGDEAHMVYQFTLPPLLLHGLLKGEARHITQWAASLPELPPECTFFNFTASHDGIGVRPLEGILPDEDIQFLCSEVEQRGGKLSYRTQPSGAKSVYEMNVTYFSALSAPDSQTGEARFLCSQFVAASLKGIPGIYIHSLTGTKNDHEGVEATGIARRINRRKWDEETLERLLQDDASHHNRVFFPYLTLLRRRARCDAFHPDGSQEVVNLDDRIFSLVRMSPDGHTRVLCLANFAAESVEVDIQAQLPNVPLQELVSDSEWERPKGPLKLAPYETLWIQSHHT